MFLRKYINFVNSLLPRRMQNEGGWIGSAIAAGASIVGSMMADDGDSGSSGAYKIRPSTVSGQDKSAFQMLYDEQQSAALDNLSLQMNDWSAQDREFFQNTYQPFQEEIIKTNQALLPSIEQTASATLEANAKDLFSNSSLKESMRGLITNTGQGVNEIATNFKAELDNLPTSEERVGQALANTELQFGRAAKELQKDLASRGQKMSQATKRQLAIDKATAKAGVAGAAAEAARTERRTALAEGAGVLSAVQTAGTQQLTALQTGQQAGLAAPQVGGVTAPSTLATTTGADLAKTTGTKTLGTETTQTNVQHTQKGIKGAVEVDDKGQLVNADKYAPKPKVIYRDRDQSDELPWDMQGGPGVGTGLGSDSPGTGGIGVGPGAGIAGAGSGGQGIGVGGVGR